MRFFTSIILSILFSVSYSFGQGTIVEDTVILSLNLEQVDSVAVTLGFPAGLLPAEYEVDVHRVVYETPDVDGSTTTTASGLVMIPRTDSCSFPMLAYLHGTKLEKDQTFYYLRGEWQLGVIAATTGYAMVMPDYIGLGLSPGIHPYQHGRSQATASIDIMRVARSIVEESSSSLNGQLFIMGYSQGGHATMATHKMIQEELNGEFVVTASAPGSGPYDLSGSQLDMVASFDPYAVPGYLPYLIQSYQHVYGNLYDSIQEIYVPPYDQTLPPLLDGSVGMGVVNQAMPAVPRDIIQPDYADAFFSDTTHPAYLALKANDVYEWIPEAPVMFNYCSSDEEVTYLNTIVASEWMLDNGASDIQVIERSDELSHFDCATPSILNSKSWFDSMAEFCAGSTNIDELSRKMNTEIYPNPNIDGFVRFSNSEPAIVRVIDLRGRELISPRKISPFGSIDLGNLSASIVLVEIHYSEYKEVKRLVVE